MLKKIISAGVKVGFIALIVVYLFKPEWLNMAFEMLGIGKRITPMIDTEKFKQQILALDLKVLLLWMFLGTSVKLCGIAAGITRWRILLHGQGVHIPVWYMCKCWFTGRAIGLFLPGTLGLDGFRLVESSLYTKEPIKCATVIAVEKLTGFIALFGLVFLTVPLGMRLFEFNMVMLAIVLTVIGGIVSVCLILLMQPRIIQVLVAVLPVPGAVRSKVNELGDAATAYSTNKTALLKALGFGFCVHLAIIMAMFCTANAVAAENVGMLDILFASPLIIVASVLTPTVSGLGVREVGMVTMLGPTSGAETALLFGHLELWTSEIFPFILSIPLLLLFGRPNRDALMEDVEKVRAAASKHTDRGNVAIKPEEVKFYESQVFSTVAFGIFGGALAGFALAFAESYWIQNTLSGLSEAGLYLWGAVAYGLIFAGVGVGVCGAFLFVYLLFNRFPPFIANLALTTGGTFAAGGMVIGIYRYQRDVLMGHAFTMPDIVRLLALVGGGALVVMALALILYGALKTLSKDSSVKLVAASVLCWLALLAVGALLGVVRAPEAKEIVFSPEVKTQGPNLILLAIDTLRADYLQPYNPNAAAKTPNIDAFVEDSVLFKYGYAQASWTKPSFASMFTGLYPESHTATGKTSIIPDSIDTLAELLRDGGYYTKGFPNNPNVSSTFNFNQGFVEYTYLDPSLYFGASSSAEKLSMYQVLRAVYQKVGDKLGMKMVVTDFYQPAETVTGLGLEWIDSGAAKDNPFYLYLHYMDPHDPFMDPSAPAGGYARVRMGDPDPAKFKEKEINIVEDMKRAYNLEIEHLDKYLGELFAGLKQRGLYDNSVILMVADHGEEFYDHKSWWHGRTLYEEQCRIPFILKLPGKQMAGTKNEHFARHVDIAPSFLHFAGIAPAPGMQTKPLFDESGVFLNEAISYVYAENDFEGNILKSVHGKDGMKLITANEGNPRGLAPEELYNYLDDYLEQKNLADDPAQGEVKSALTQSIADFQEVIKNNAAEPQNMEDFSPELQQQLGGLGYLE